jgi:hypothetical protein
MNELAEKVILLVNCQEQDLLRANFWFLYSKSSTKLQLILLLPFTALLYWLLSSSTQGGLVDNFLWFLLALVPLFTVVGLPLGIWFQTKRNFASLKEFQKNLRYEFSVEGYEVKDEKSSSQISWESIHKVVETKFAFNLFFHKSLFHTVPKRCLQQPHDIERLRKILKEGLGKKAQLA